MMLNRTHFFALSIFGYACVFCGCQQTAAETPIAAASQQVDQQKDGGGGLVETMSGLVDKAKAKAPSIKDIKKALGDVGDTTGQTAEDSTEWVQDAWKMLRDSGMTQTKSATDWVKQDWNAMHTWEYSVISIGQSEINKDREVLERKLNEAGQDRWECFAVTQNNNYTKFFMKRQSKSYLKNVPLKDMLKLAPMLDTKE